MLKVLNESFGTPDDIERHKISCAIFNARMRKRASIIDHLLYMIEQIECLRKFDFFLQEQYEKDAILNFLPKSYLSFLSHFWMTKSVVNYHDLLELLQTFEKDNQLHKETVNLVGGSSLGSHQPFKKEKKKKNKKVQGAGSQSQKFKFKTDQSQAEYFCCKK